MPNYLLHLTFDGTDFHGWQSQSGDRTVQDVVEAALAGLLGPGLRLAAAGRTDAGVHAVDLPANFKSGVIREPDVIVRALNATLPADVKVHACEIMPDGFSARFDALSRSYRYIIETAPCYDPITRRFACQTSAKLRWELVDEALPALLGEHDFSSFRGSGCASKSPVRRMLHAGREEISEHVHTLEFEAGGFLRGMVRSIVGTLLEIGSGARPASGMASLLANPDRSKAGVAAPAHGLFFVTARYREIDDA